MATSYTIGCRFNDLKLFSWSLDIRIKVFPIIYIFQLCHQRSNTSFKAQFSFYVNVKLKETFYKGNICNFIFFLRKFKTSFFDNNFVWNCIKFYFFFWNFILEQFHTTIGRHLLLEYLFPKLQNNFYNFNFA